MADELKYTLNVTHVNGDLKVSYASGQVGVDQTTKGAYSNVQVVGTSEEAIATGADLTAFGYCLLVNLDASNYVEFGPDSGGSGGTMVAIGKLNAGEHAWLRLKPGITLKAQANGAAVRLLVTILDA